MSAGMPDPEWASEHRGTLSPDSFLCRIFESALIVDAVKDEGTPDLTHTTMRHQVSASTNTSI